MNKTLAVPVVIRNSWIVLIPGYAPITMGGEPMTHDQALYAARLIWPDAEIQR